MLHYQLVQCMAKRGIAIGRTANIRKQESSPDRGSSGTSFNDVYEDVSHYRARLGLLDWPLIHILLTAAVLTILSLCLHTCVRCHTLIFPYRVFTMVYMYLAMSVSVSFSPSISRFLPCSKSHLFSFLIHYFSHFLIVIIYSSSILSFLTYIWSS